MVASSSPQLPAATLRRSTARSGGAMRRRREAQTAYLLIAPAFALFVWFIAGPLIGALGLSFFSYDLLNPPKFIGLGNYNALFHDPVALQAFKVTLIFATVSVILHVSVGLALALLVKRNMRPALRYILRTAFFFPVLISWAVVSLVAEYVLDPNFGFITYYLQQLGIGRIGWFTDTHLALASILGVDLWHSVGFTFLVLLAGLQAIPKDMYEAARVDGAGRFATFRHITVPLLSPSLFFVTVISIIGAFQIFEPIHIITLGGPGYATESIAQYIYDTGFTQLNMGYAATLGLVLFFLLLFVTILQLGLSRRWVHYELGE
jgi:multiple sugar transport system permease protein